MRLRALKTFEFFAGGSENFIPDPTTFWKPGQGRILARNRRQQEQNTPTEDKGEIESFQNFGIYRVGSENFIPDPTTFRKGSDLAPPWQYIYVGLKIPGPESAEAGAGSECVKWIGKWNTTVKICQYVDALFWEAESGLAFEWKAGSGSASVLKSKSGAVEAQNWTRTLRRDRSQWRRGRFVDQWSQIHITVMRSRIRIRIRI